MRDPNEEALNKYLNAESAAEKRAEGVQKYAAFLIEEGQDFYPFSHDNVSEALGNCNDAAMLALSSQIESAEKNPQNSVAQECVAFTLRNVIRDYWKAAAQEYAELNYSEEY